MFNKVRFTGCKGSTAGLIVTSEAAKDMVQVSRLYPYSEADKMELYQVSPDFGTWEGAFGYQFTAEGDANV